MAQIPCELCNGILDEECTECFGRGVVEGRRSNMRDSSPADWYGHAVKDEVWKPFPKVPHYLVSNLGRMMNSDTGRMMRRSPNPNGYLLVKTQHNHEKLSITMHRIVAELFLPDWDPKREVKFIDGDMQNVAASNLRMGDRMVRGKNKKTKGEN